MPSIDTLVQLARFYQVTVGYLVAGEDSPAQRATATSLHADAVGLLIAARFHPDIERDARAALITALHAGIPLWDLALETGRSGLELATLIDDDQLRRRALETELASACDYAARVRAAVRAVRSQAQAPSTTLEDSARHSPQHTEVS